MSNKLTKKEAQELAQDEQRKQEIIDSALGYDFLSVMPVEKAALAGRKRIPIAEIATFGTALQPLVMGIQSMMEAGGSGLYMVNAKGGTLVQFANGNGFMGAISKGDNKIGGGMAELTQVGFSPEMAAMAGMAVALADIEHRLNQIQQTQEEMFAFIEKKDEYMLKGSMYFLLDILSNYKYNITNEKYKEINHLKILDIKESAEQSILLYSDLVQNITDDRAFLHIDATVKDRLKKLQGYFRSYQVALYNYAFSAFLDVILLGNFDAEFLDSIVSKIDKYSLAFRESYTIAYEKIEAYNDSSVDTKVIKGVGIVASKLGSGLAKTKKLDKIGGQLNDTGNALKELNDVRKEEVMEQVISNRTNYALPFMDAIKYIKQIYNTEFNVIISNDSLYFAVA